MHRWQFGAFTRQNSWTKSRCIFDWSTAAKGTSPHSGEATEIDMFKVEKSWDFGKILMHNDGIMLIKAKVWPFLCCVDLPAIWQALCGMLFHQERAPAKKLLRREDSVIHSKHWCLHDVLNYIFFHADRQMSQSPVFLSPLAENGQQEANSQVLSPGYLCDRIVFW